MEQGRWFVVVAGSKSAMAEALAGLLEGFEDVIPFVPGATKRRTVSRRSGAIDNAVIVLDIDGDRADMLAALANARAHAPDAPVITLQADTADAVPAGVGEVARLSKCITPEELVSVIRAVHDGQGVFSGARRGAAGSGATPDRFDCLTDRELEVLRLLVTGAPNAAIGAALDISAHTVRSHVRSLISKLGCKDRFDVATSAHQFGLVAYLQHAAR